MASTAGSTAVDTAISGPQTPTVRQRFSDFAHFVVNTDEEQVKVLGRTKESWGLIGLFYLIYYACLAGFFAGMMAVFYHTLDWNIPKLTGSDSLLKQQPGLSFRPIPNVMTTLIRFNKARPSTYTPYVDHIEGFLQSKTYVLGTQKNRLNEMRFFEQPKRMLKLMDYENKYQQSEQGIMDDCDSVPKMRPEDQWFKACRFDIKDLGASCVKQQSFGYEDGQPCVLMKLNRVFDWIPQPYDSNLTAPAHLENWYQYAIKVQCEGENPADKDNIGDITYFPSSGFHFKYFPYRNQQGYRSPLVFVRFENPEPAVLIMVTCKIYAKNIYHDVMQRAGQVHFELMVD